MKHPAMLARVKIENCRFAREREICIEKMASSIFLSSCIFSSNPWLSSWNRLQAWNAWHGKESTRSHLNASWHFYNVRKYLKNVSFSKVENIRICFLKEIGIWKYFSLTKIVKNRENRNDSQFLQNFDTKKMRLLVDIFEHCVLVLRGQNSLDHHYVKHPVFYCITAICPPTPTTIVVLQPKPLAVHSLDLHFGVYWSNNTSSSFGFWKWATLLTRLKLCFKSCCPLRIVWRSGLAIAKHLQLDPL